MKKKIKVVVLIYVGVALFTYAISLRVNKLNSMEDTNNQNQSMVLKLK